MVGKVIIKVNTQAKEESVTIENRSKSGKVIKSKLNKVANRKIAKKGTKATMKRKACSKRNTRAKRSVAATSKTRKSGTPTRKSGTPTRKSATPTRKSGTPTRKSGTPTRKSGTPTRKSATPTRKSGTPTRKSATPTRRAGSKKRCTSKTCSNASSIMSTKELVSIPSVGPAFARRFRELGVCNTRKLRLIAKCSSRYAFSKWLKAEVCANKHQVKELGMYFKEDFAVKSTKTEVKEEKKEGGIKEKTEASPATAGESL